MWTSIILIGFLPVSGALWADKSVRGVVGRAITIDCHYEEKYSSHTKYWCHGWTIQCSTLVETKGQHGRRGRVSITDNPEQGIFTVTMEDLHSGDTGWYSCGITTPGADLMFHLHLQISEEPVSVPVLRYLSPANISHLGGSVLVSCESLQGSLPIQYTWHEKHSSRDQMISDTNELVLPCQSLDLQAHRYYCNASNRLGIKSSGMLNVTIFSNTGICSYVTEINDTISGALWTERYVRGVVGRVITIDCHYEEKYRSHTKYWCRGWTRHCLITVETKQQHGQRGRVAISDNPEWGIFNVTVKNLRSGDTGWYSCGITTPDADPMFHVHLQVSYEPVSVPVLRYLSPANVSRLGGSVSVSCESLQGSLPIQYRWYEQTSSGHPKISDNKELTLHCQYFNQTHHQYYCSASNSLGVIYSGKVNVIIFNNGEICSYVTEINGIISGALWAEDKVRGVVGRAVTIDCHYAPMYRSHTKYFCHMWGRQCTSLVNTNGTNEQYGRMTIRDNISQGIFTVTVENLVSQDTGHYRCGITTSGNHPMFDVHLQVSNEPVSVPVLQFLSPANVSCVEGSVSLSCESVQGSPPIQYTWHENTSSVISVSDKLDLHCQSNKYQHHQYYCTASNTRGAKSSEIVNVSVYNREGNCSFVIRFTGTGREYSCETFTTVSTASFMIWKVVRWLFFTLLMIGTISVTWFTRQTKKPDESDPHRLVYKVK
ncbi:polymeric immunoglobulin receptor-like [Hemitrygon akajei]|uniref:polymeric immunoglobulin receptor-like n=1 Tax=Hemitrygon akajei TaxID=2704970 RepID=UPI003BF9B012